MTLTLPTPAVIYRALQDECAALRKLRVFEEVDVRLQVLPDGKWFIHSGDPSYDTHHQGYWGATIMHPHDGARLLHEYACELLLQVADDAAHDEPVSEVA